MCALRNGKVHLTKENDSSRKPSTTVSTSRSEGEKLMGRSLLLCNVIERSITILRVYTALDKIYIANVDVDFPSFLDRQLLLVCSYSRLQACSPFCFVTLDFHVASQPA